MTLPCPHCGLDVQIAMTELGRTEEIGPAESAVHPPIGSSRAPLNTSPARRGSSAVR